MTWRVPRIWEGGECWILGGGPSLPRQFGVPEEVIQNVMSQDLPLSSYSPYMTPIHKKHVIGVNTAFLIGDWIDMVFWGDKNWYLKNRNALAGFKGLKVTCHPYFANGKFRSENVKHTPKDNSHNKGISPTPHKVSWNANSGAAAISVAANMGVKRIVLLGFDMKLGTDGRQHWHSKYSGPGEYTPREEKKLPFLRHLAGFPAIARDAHGLGIEIINACPDSSINVFPRMTAMDVLNGMSVPVVDISKLPPPDSPPVRIMRGGRRRR